MGISGFINKNFLNEALNLKQFLLLVDSFFDFILVPIFFERIRENSIEYDETKAHF